MLLYSLTIFLSAFLLFQVQPIIAKMILPWFGGSSAVWSTCMLFFQMVLLLGYGYAHWLSQRLRAGKQAGVHIAALAVSLVSLPIVPNPVWKAAGGAPSLRILALLTLTVGLPYFLLSSTSPLLQAWYARNHRDAMPYRLFALSNFASMLALLSYPFLIEPNLPTRVQGILWSAGYASFAALCGLTAWRASRRAPLPVLVTASGSRTLEAPAIADRLLWIGLASCASVLLLAVTTYLTQDVAAIPFLWIVPLSLYLLSFIICFEAPRFYLRPAFLPLAAAALVFMAYRVWPEHGSMAARPQIVLLGAALFICCMVCHGELARLRPHPRFLTGFYVNVSLGGALGGLFVGLLAPEIFRAYYEFPIGLGLCAVLVVLSVAPSLWRARNPLLRWAAGGLAVGLLVYLGFLGYFMRQMVSGYRVVARNFYGQLRVADDGDPREDEYAARKLLHGVINHGQQILNEPYRHMAGTYFCPGSGIGRAMSALKGPWRRIGILGLGCGSLAAYGRSGDTIRIYEINPQVLEVASREFTYLRDTPAKVEVALGDGRLVLESEPAQRFDLLVMDAFSGDSVPVHLITREAFQSYFRHLKPDGILAVNISNKYLDLEPVIRSAARSLGKTAFVYHFSPAEDDYVCFSCSWSLVMNPPTAAAYPELEQAADQPAAPRPFRTWTDDFSNMFAILK